MRLSSILPTLAATASVAMADSLSSRCKVESVDQRGVAQISCVSLGHGHPVGNRVDLNERIGNYWGYLGVDLEAHSNQGGFANSCNDIYVSGYVLHAHCKNGKGGQLLTETNLEDWYGPNDDGTVRFLFS